MASINDAIQYAVRALKTAGEFAKKAYDMYYNPTPLDVQTEVYDENGNLVTSSIPNIAKWRDTIWRDAQRALDKSVYVDQQNGSDTTGDGSATTSIYAAKNSVPPGGSVDIFIKGTYILKPPEFIPLLNKYVRFLGGPDDKLVIDAAGNGRRFILFNSVIELGIDTEIRNTGATSFANIIYLLGNSLVKTRPRLDGQPMSLFIDDFSLFVGGGEPMISLRIANTNITTNAGKLANGPNLALDVYYITTTLNGSQITETDVASLLLQIVRDESGYPINILHNRKL